ncbi:hypothetical protein [Brachybacterium sp. YJGR34]|uniref:hypothetical protein n=1 Tax=Brachybacterium sp. YJGR34 TaxID=2059911 RepID=UPI000E0BFB4D|nr:hypothetical protein [Brachybacterium sp. YJGR34]
MHTGPQYTSTQPQGPGSGGGRGAALLIGGLAFAVVFLLIVGGTVGYLVLRTGGSGGGGAQVTSSSTAPDPESSQATTSADATPTDVEEETCWTPEGTNRTSSNPSGKLRGGGLQFIPPAEFDGRTTAWWFSFLDDSQTAYATVEENWQSTLTVGEVVWQPGVEYPGAEAASERITTCIFRASIWGDTSGRSLDDEVTEPVTISGMPGYRTTATVNWESSDLERTDAALISVTVLDTPQGPSAFISETAAGVAEHEEGAQAAYESLTGYS